MQLLTWIIHNHEYTKDTKTKKRMLQLNMGLDSTFFVRFVSLW